jgi:tetraacyldisaccharide 4'-kinase
MGGRGKTPLVAHIARILLDAGERPSILSRGYGRRQVEDGVVVVSDGLHLLADLDRSGDEPLMLARATPGAVVLVCDQRAIAGALAERHLGATVHLLDDGFQHRSLCRDVDIVVVSPDDFRDRPLPFGRLRESIASLADADAVIVDAGDAEVPPLDLPGRVPASVARFALRRSLGQARALEPERPEPAKPGPIVALAAIARPERFFGALRAAGWQIAREVAFRDHHPYAAADLARLADEVKSAGATAVVTTEKDAERLLPWRPFPVHMAAVPLEIALEPGDAFPAWLLGRLREARA